MDEAMDTSSDVVTLSDDDEIRSEVRDNAPMDTTTSPILTRRPMRLVQRPARNVVSSSGWLSASVSRQESSGGTFVEAASSRGNQVAANDSNSLNQEEHVIDAGPPPIEDTDLIMIHRPASPTLFGPEDINEVQEVPPGPHGDASDHVMDFANEGSSSNPGTSSGENSSESITIHLSENRDQEHQAGIGREDEEVQIDERTAEEMPLDGNNDHIQPSDAPEASASVAPDVENLPLAQRIRSPDLIPLARDSIELSSPERNHPVINLDRSPSEINPSERSPAARSPPERSPASRSVSERSPPSKKAKVDPVSTNTADSDEEDEGKLCPICFDAWTNSGDHRLVSLRCGHLFGQHCIKHWLEIHKANDRKCPQCKKKATVKDIRALYASKIRVLDTSEQEALKETIKKLEEEKERLTRELAYERQLRQDALKVQQDQELKLKQLQSQGIYAQSSNRPLPATSTLVATAAAQIKISLTSRIEVSRDGGCRVLAFNEWKGILVASQSSVTPLFPDFGIKMIDTEEFRLRQSVPLHTKAIRDLSFNPHRKDLLLTASLDKTAKMFCMSSNSSVMSFNAEVPLWSCCWDGNNSNVFFAGSQNGITFQYDIRNAHTEVCRITTPGDGTPVISLNAIPAGTWLPNGGFLCCRLNRIRVYERTTNSEFKAYPLQIDGPFSALNYNHKSHHMLVSTRPSQQNAHVQHHLYEMAFARAQPQTNIVHSFLGSTTQRVMSRPCQVEIDGNVKDTLICAHQESEGHVAIWSLASGQKIPAGPLNCAEHILDLCPLKTNNRTYLASLSDKTLRVYNFS